jgi:hypothetical protein
LRLGVRFNPQFKYIKLNNDKIKITLNKKEINWGLGPNKGNFILKKKLNVNKNI